MVLFDLGNVLVHWDPRHLYRRLLPESEVERFLSEVCTREWNYQLDLGTPFPDAVAELCSKHPQHRQLIEAYHHRWIEMVPGPVEGMPELVDELHAAGVPMYLLTNSSADKFPLVAERFPSLLGRLSGAVVSGAVGLAKPETAIFDLVCDRFGLSASEVVFVDDQEVNVTGARAAGMAASLFRSAAQLRRELAEAGLLGG